MSFKEHFKQYCLHDLTDVQFQLSFKLRVMASWSSGMILVYSVRGPVFKFQTDPSFSYVAETF